MKTREKMAWRPWLPTLGLLAAAASSCTLLVGTFEQGGGPGGATSSTTTNSGGSGTSSSQGGTGGHSGGGTGGTGGCTSIADCNSPPNVCVISTCTGGVCGFENLPEGDMKSQNVPGDCHLSQCDGLGNVDTTVIDTSNLPPTTNPCLAGTCDPLGTPGTSPLTSGTPCTVGGKVCDGAGQCVQCIENEDCTNGASCTPSHFCVPPSCTDQVQDNLETDVDCGGGGANPCSPCADGKNCMAGSDCVSGVCGTGNTCVTPTCTDGVKNQSETDQDCGGNDGCTKCGPGKTCLAGTDCVGGQCGGGTCTATCTDLAQNNQETDIDCGGNCSQKCAVGKKCKVNPDCTSNACDAGTLLCVANQCIDHKVDGSETDVDCGGGTCPTCAVNKTCAIDSDCASNACDALALICVLSQCVDNHQNGQESDVDCGGPTCTTRCAVNKKCVSDSDCTTMACNSTTLKCDSSHCTDAHKNSNETDVDCGGVTCSKCATGKSCLVDSDCLSTACNISTLKCATQCTDGKKDGAESDVDCGGGTCPTCVLGKACTTNTDCASNACDFISFTCVSNQCADNHKDGAESDSDCGGGTCAACGLGKMCALNFDCSSNACDGISSLCVSNQCVDNHKDGAETDIDCGGGTCAQCATGKKCLTNFDCQSGFCSTGTPKTCL